VFKKCKFVKMDLTGLVIILGGEAAQNNHKKPVTSQIPNSLLLYRKYNKGGSLGVDVVLEGTCEARSL
jgi:hypothetical protein